MSDRSTRLNIEDDGDTIISPATAGKQDTIIQGVRAMSGLGSKGSITLSATTVWTQVPQVAAVPSSDYILVVSKETETGVIRFGLSDDGEIPSAASGNKMTSDDIIFHLAGSAVVYFHSTVATDVVNWTAKIV